MQDSKLLTQQDIELLTIAQYHIKQTYQDKLTSIVAVLKTKKGNIYTGVNVKYKPIWKCICAERVAIAKAVEAKDLEFESITSVKYFPETDSYEVINMCGECRQIAICHSPLNVIANNKGQLKVVPIEEIFPYPYI